MMITWLKFFNEQGLRNFAERKIAQDLICRDLWFWNDQHWLMNVISFGDDLEMNDLLFRRETFLCFENKRYSAETLLSAVSSDQSSYSSLAGLHSREWAGDSWLVHICLFLFIEWAAKPSVLVVSARPNAWVAADFRSRITFTLRKYLGGSPFKGLLARWDLSAIFLL